MKLYYLPRTAIEAEILFAARIMQVRFLKRLSGKTPLEQSSSGKKIGAESAVLHPSFLTGIGIVAGTIIEDIATLGVGIANAPATLALGFTLIAGTYSMVSHNRGCEK